MKNVFFFCMIFFSIGGFSQTPYSYSEVIQADGMDTKTIYNTAKGWFVSYYKDANSVIQVDNPTDGILTGKGGFKFDIKSLTWGAGSGFITYIVDIRIKEGRFKVILSNFTHTSSNTQYGDYWSIGLINDTITANANKQIRKVQSYAIPECKLIAHNAIVSLKEYFKASPGKKDDDNW